MENKLNVHRYTFTPRKLRVITFIEEDSRHPEEVIKVETIEICSQEELNSLFRDLSIFNSDKENYLKKKIINL